MGNEKRMKKPKNRQTKVALVFDETARRDYLTGFRKRKNERRKKAKHDQEEQLKNEKREFKKQRVELIKKSFKYSGKSKQSLPDITDLVQPEVYEMPSHTVTITDISQVDMAGHTGLRLGHNEFEENGTEPTAAESAEKKESAAALKKKLKKLKKKQISKSLEGAMAKKKKNRSASNAKLSKKKKLSSKNCKSTDKKDKRQKTKKDKKKVKRRN